MKYFKFPAHRARFAASSGVLDISPSGWAPNGYVIIYIRSNMVEQPEQKEANVMSHLIFITTRENEKNTCFEYPYSVSEIYLSYNTIRIKYIRRLFADDICELVFSYRNSVCWLHLFLVFYLNISQVNYHNIVTCSSKPILIVIVLVVRWTDCQLGSLAVNEIRKLYNQFADLCLQHFPWVHTRGPFIWYVCSSSRRDLDDWRRYHVTQITRFMGPTWGPPGTDRTKVGPMLAPWTLLSG